MAKTFSVGRSRTVARQVGAEDYRLLCVKEAARRLAVSTKPLYRWVASGVLPAHRLGRQLRISEADLVAFLRGRRL